MAVMGTPGLAFSNVPLEIHQQIASYFDKDNDIGNYRLICRATNDAIDADGNSFWRARFLAIFEKPSFALTGCRLTDNRRYRDTYKKRREILMHGLQKKAFKFGESKMEKKCLTLMVDLMKEACSENKNGDGETTYESKNLGLVRAFIKKHRFLANNRTRERGPNGRAKIPCDAFFAIKCALAPTLFSLEDPLCNDHFGFDDAQQMAYFSAVQMPIFGGCTGQKINMPWLHAQLTFWRYHFLHQHDGLLQNDFKALEACDRPRYWKSQLTQDAEPKALGRHWKGSYAFVDRDVIARIRGGHGLQEHIIDEMSGEQTPEPFQHICLEPRNPCETVWPQEFEKHLKSLTPPLTRTRTRAQKQSASHDGPELQSLRFDGEGYDASEDFMASGWLNQLPVQEDIPGWQRMTMMKYFVDEDTGAIDHEALWAYEGVVLPGGMMMVGRWWCPSDGDGAGMYSGPFILWDVDGAKYEDGLPR